MLSKFTLVGAEAALCSQTREMAKRAGRLPGCEVV